MTAPPASPGFARGAPDGLCLDFANTKFWRGLPEPTEELREPADLLGWCDLNGGVDARTLEAARRHWSADEAAGLAGLADAVGLREALYRVFAAASEGARPKLADLGTLNAALAAAPERGALGWEW